MTSKFSQGFNPPNFQNPVESSYDKELENFNSYRAEPDPDSIFDTDEELHTRQIDVDMVPPNLHQPTKTKKAKSSLKMPKLSVNNKLGGFGKGILSENVFLEFFTMTLVWSLLYLLRNTVKPENYKIIETIISARVVLPLSLLILLFLASTSYKTIEKFRDIHKSNLDTYELNKAVNDTSVKLENINKYFLSYSIFITTYLIIYVF